MNDFDQLLTFFKALGNENRLRIIALLADQDATVREIAEAVGLKEPTVSEHLAILKDAGLVTMRADGNFRIYSFNARLLIDMNRDLLNRERLAALAAPTDDDRVLRNYLKEDGRLKTIPSVRKNLLVILKWLAEHFEVGRKYTEKEVNAVILQYHEDYATLRRELIGHQLMQREKGIYWRNDV